MAEYVKRKTAPNTVYVDNKSFTLAMVEYRRTVLKAKREKLKKPIVPEYIAECLILIATRLAMLPRFINYSYKNDFISDAIENCLTYIDNFKISKSKNAFGYFTMICYWAFVRRIHKERKQQYIKAKSIIQSSIFNELCTTSEYDEAITLDPGLAEFNNDKMIEFIKTYEKKKGLIKKRKKKINLTINIDS